MNLEDGQEDDVCGCSSPLSSPAGEITVEEVEQMHRRYFDALVDMFEKFKHRHEGYEDASIVLSND